MKALPISSSPVKKVLKKKSISPMKFSEEVSRVLPGSKKLVTSSKVSLKKTSSPYIKKIKRYTKQGIKSALLSPVFHAGCKMVFIAVLIVGTLFTAYRVIGKTFANEVVVSQSEIIARVAKLTPVPQEVPHEIVRVQDAETLKKQNVFYKDIKEGDYILMYTDLAVIYDLRNNQVIAVKRNESVVPKF